MKRILSVILSLMAIAGCEDLLPGQEGNGIVLGEGMLDSYGVSPEGESISLTFVSPVDWEVLVKTDAEESDWLTVSPESGVAGQVELTAVARRNESGQSRMANMTILAGDHAKKITFTQDALVVEEENYFRLSTNSVAVEAEGGQFEIEVFTDQGYMMEVVSDWIAEVSKVGTVHTFSVLENASEQERKGLVTFCSDVGLCVSLTVVQKGAVASAPDWPEFPHKSLAIRFTADWCGYCPAMAENFHSAEKQIPGKFEIMNVHGGESSYDFSGFAKFDRYFNIQGFPTGIVDYRRNVYYASEVVSAVEETEANYPAVTGIEVSTAMEGGNLSADVKLYVKEAGDYKLTAIVVENSIIGWQNGVNGNYIHDRVARVALTEVLGDLFTVSEDFSIREFSLSGDMPSEYNHNNLELIVYVTREFGSQKKLSDYGNWYVDNCIAVTCGESAGNLDGGNEDINQGEDIEM